MGTLTADCPRLEDHCPHKLAASCRLTSTPNCCACVDERPHAQRYRVYIDGVGFVHRGTRWQSYCWFCKEFWNNRLAATEPPLEPSQTQIPNIPNQDDFLARWSEFHQGYRIANMADGTEQRFAVVGEPLKEVSPGFLPRTLDELRAGLVNDTNRPANRMQRHRLALEEQDQATHQQQQQGIEDALDLLLAENSEEDDNHRSPASEHIQPSSSAADTQARLQRARDRLVALFGTREDVQRDDYVSPLASMYSRAESRYQEAEARRAARPAELPAAEAMTRDEQRQLQQELQEVLQRDLRSVRDHAMRLHSTSRSTPQTSTAQNVSPPAAQPSQLAEPALSLASAFSASTWEDTDSNSLLRPPPTPASSMDQQHDGVQQQQRRRPRIQIHPNPSSPLASLATARRSSTSSTYTSTGSMSGSTSSPRAVDIRYRPRTPPSPSPTLDNPIRPEPLPASAMMVNLACQVCYAQLADTVLIPCGHVIMCRWCADVVCPVKMGHIVIQPAGSKCADGGPRCPMCRKGVKQRFAVHVGAGSVDEEVSTSRRSSAATAVDGETDSSELVTGDRSEQEGAQGRTNDTQPIRPRDRLYEWKMDGQDDGLDRRAEAGNVADEGVAAS